MAKSSGSETPAQFLELTCARGRLLEYLLPSWAFRARRASHDCCKIFLVCEIQAHAASLYRSGVFGLIWTGDPTIRDVSGVAATLSARLHDCQEENPDATYGLISATCGRSLDCVPAGITTPPLCMAAARGFRSTLLLLLEERAGLNEHSTDGLTPLDHAISMGKAGAAQLLLDQGGESSHPHDALRVAVGYRGFTSVVRSLIDNCGADVDGAIDAAVEYGDVQVALELMSCQGASDRPWTKQWALRRAAVIGDVEALRIILAMPRVDIEEGAGGSWGTALHLATEGGHLEASRALLASRADPRALRVCQTRCGMKQHISALQLAQKCAQEKRGGHAEELVALIQKACGD